MTLPLSKNGLPLAKGGLPLNNANGCACCGGDGYTPCFGCFVISDEEDAAIRAEYGHYDLCITSAVLTFEDVVQVANTCTTCPEFMSFKSARSSITPADTYTPSPPPRPP